METVRETLTGWAEDAKKNTGMIVLLGVVAVIAGFLALVMPWVSGVGVTLVVGFAMVVGGVARLVGVFHAAFIGGALTLLAGVILVARPGVGLAVLTLMVGAYLLVDGIFGAVLAFHVRPEKGWGWMFFSAAAAFLLGVLLLAEWPLSGLWAIGTLVGINMLFAGFSMISIGSAARKLVKKVE